MGSSQRCLKFLLLFNLRHVLHINGNHFYGSMRRFYFSATSEGFLQFHNKCRFRITSLSSSLPVKCFSPKTSFESPTKQTALCPMRDNAWAVLSSTYFRKHFPVESFSEATLLSLVLFNICIKAHGTISYENPINTAADKKLANTRLTFDKDRLDFSVTMLRYVGEVKYWKKKLSDCESWAGKRLSWTICCYADFCPLCMKNSPQGLV